MPLFKRSFSTSKLSQRKSQSLSNIRDASAGERTSDFHAAIGDIQGKVGETTLTFDKGKWTIASPGSGHPQKEDVDLLNALKKKNQTVQEEKNLLTLKVELLLDMLAETACEIAIQEKDIEVLRRKLDDVTRTNKAQKKTKNERPRLRRGDTASMIDTVRVNY